MPALVKFNIVLAAAVAALLPWSQAWAGGRPAQAFLPLGDSTAAPTGFIQLCESGSANTLCARPGGMASPLARFAGNARQATFRFAQQQTGGLRPCDARSLLNVFAPSLPQLCASAMEPFVTGIAPARRPDLAPTAMAAPCATDLLGPIALPAPWEVAARDGACPIRGAAAVDMAAPAPPVALEAMPLLRRINQRVNGRVRQQSDGRTYGVAEHWQRSGTGRKAQGDCEDFAIEKRLLLVDEGFPADKLAFAVVYSRSAGLHTVLLARTDEGDVVLDSRTPYVEPWSSVGYSWVSIQSMNDPMEWRALAST